MTPPAAGSWRDRLFGGLRDAAGEGRELVGREADGAADRLAMPEKVAIVARLQLVGVLRRHFDEVAEHADATGDRCDPLHQPDRVLHA